VCFPAILLVRRQSQTTIAMVAGVAKVPISSSCFTVGGGDEGCALDMMK